MVLAVVLALVGAVTVATAIERPQPSYAGSARVPGLDAQVRIVRDVRGVPQVYASSSRDLFYAQGYAQAQDQFFAMDFRRHVASGRLSELVGPDRAALASDEVVRTLGWRTVASQEWRLLSPESRRYLQDYADGVNAYLAGRSKSRLSVSYTVMGFRARSGSVRPWSPIDSLTWFKAMAWDLASNDEQEIDRALALGSVGDVRRVDQLFPAYDSGARRPVLDGQGTLSPQSVPVGVPAGQRAEPAQGWLAGLPAQAAGVRAALDAVPHLLGSGDGLGSNAWVVSGAHTNSGEPLLASDPHLALGAPGTWYQSGLHCTRVTDSCPFDVTGFGVAGVPGILVGHNRTLAWSLTSMGADVSDLYIERVRGGQYLRDGSWLPLTTRRETIRVAGRPGVTITVRSTGHGPVLSDVVGSLGVAARAGRAQPASDESYAMALAWSGAVPGHALQAVFEMDRAGDQAGVETAAGHLESPALDVLWADTGGHIGYQAAGRVPVRSNRFLSEESLPTDGTWPQPGWTSATDWHGWVPADQMPRAVNPAEGFFVAANQEVTADNRPALGSDWDYGYRAQTIRTTLEHRIASRQGVTADSMSALQNSTVNPFAARLVPFLTGITVDRFTAQAQDLLRGWDGSQPADSAAAAYFNAVWAHVLRLTFGDELPADAWPDGGSRWFAVVDRLLDQPDDAWWDSKLTPSVVETRDSILAQAMVDARKELTTALGKDPRTWQWGRIHRLELTGPTDPVVGSAPGAVRTLLGIAPVEVGGGSGAVDATAWNAAHPGDYRVTSGPSMRMVVDLGGFDRSTWIVVPGVSGHPWDAHHADQVRAWAAGHAEPWLFSESAVNRSVKNVLTLRPRG